MLCVSAACNSESKSSEASGAPTVVATSNNVATAAPSVAVAPTAAEASAAVTSSAAADKPEETIESRTYAVFNVKPNDVLNVRAEPDPKSAKVYSFGPGVKRVKSTGKQTRIGNTPWIEVNFEGGAGWVNRQFITEVAPSGGCNDSELTAAIRQFMRSVDRLDGGALEEMVSPLRGLILRYHSTSTDVRFSQGQVGGLYASSAVKDWGTAPQTQAKVTGSFKDVWLEDMKAAVAGKGSQEKCGKLLMGPTAGATEWPEDLQGLTIVSFHRPAGAQPWHTTLAGFEYVDGKPYLAALIGYR